MVRWDGSTWNQLETSEKNDDGTFTYYETKTNAFSNFAITQFGEAGSNTLPQGTARSGISANVTGTAPAPAEAASEGGQPVNFVIIIVVLAVIGTVVAVYLKNRGIF